jgi:hypothetical protein
MLTKSTPATRIVQEARRDHLRPGAWEASEGL